MNVSDYNAKPAGDRQQAEAWTSLPVAELDALRAENERLQNERGIQARVYGKLKAENERWQETVKQYRQEIDAEHAENERLERRFREAEAEWVKRYEDFEAENTRLRENLEAIQLADDEA